MVRHEGPRGSSGTGDGEDGGGSMTIRLGADPAAVLTPPSVEMSPGADHEIFSFKGTKGGAHTIHASAGGEFVEGAVTVIDPASDGRGPAITPPPSTRTPHIVGAVHLVERAPGARHATAVPAESDLEVSLSDGGAGVLAPDEVIIPAGSTRATFDALVAAVGTVHARGGGMRAEAYVGSE